MALHVADRLTATALTIYLLFALLGFGGRVWLQHRWTGDSGVRRFTGRIGALGWASLWLLTLGACAAPLSAIADLWRPGWLRLPLPEPIRPGGLVLMAAGLMVVLIAQVQMGVSWRVGVDTGETTALVTSGLFGSVRNPIYTAVLVLVFGGLLAVPNVFSGWAFLAGLAGTELLVRRVEEPYLRRVHGESYRAYARQVGRFLPGLGRMS